MSTSPTQFLDLPLEIRQEILRQTQWCPLNAPPCNPILSRRLNQAFFCGNCSGEVLMRVSKHIRLDIAPVFFARHAMQFQLWYEHHAALHSWFDAVSEDAVRHFRAFRLNTQYANPLVDLASLPGTATAMPGYIAIDLDAVPEQVVMRSNTWTSELLEEPATIISALVKSLERVNGKPVLNKQAFLSMVEAVGWFGMRDEREREMVIQENDARGSRGVEIVSLLTV